jgi:hypothetical protein
VAFVEFIMKDDFWNTLLIGLILVSGVGVFGWFEYRRNIRLPHLGTVLVKNRLKRSG